MSWHSDRVRTPSRAHTNQSTEASDAESYNITSSRYTNLWNCGKYLSEDFRSITKKLASATLKTLGPHHSHKADRIPEQIGCTTRNQGTVVSDPSWLRDDCKIG